MYVTTKIEINFLKKGDKTKMQLKWPLQYLSRDTYNWQSDTFGLMFLPETLAEMIG